ncbi:ubiquinol-cytochrome c reductase iron-sulfur subunit [Rhodoblastus sp.]|uniref:ubiquinol-cytochrome c reductase iron-sulfur subunit n=1 Tax=Rhodoblastus sp. TaxID=1962975 RepID=UPI003F9AAC81
MIVDDLKTDASQAETQKGSRRDFLYIATGAVAAVGVGATIWPLIDQMQPDATTLAAGAPLDLDVGSLAAGQQIIIKWRGHPIFIVNRPADALKTLQDPALVGLLSDPHSLARQQPGYADNWHRSLKPEFAVLVGICTHLGCIPIYKPNKNQLSPGWLGGWFCPCHGSKYDLAGRVFRNVPAPYNLPVPPYRFVTDKTIRIGENPEGQKFELESVTQL